MMQLLLSVGLGACFFVGPHPNPKLKIYPGEWVFLFGQAFVVYHLVVSALR